MYIFSLHSSKGELCFVVQEVQVSGDFIVTTEGFQDVKSVRIILYYFFQGCIFRLGKSDLILQLYQRCQK